MPAVVTVGKIPDIVQNLSPKMPPLLLVGPTGIGKTTAVAEGARRAGRPLAAIPPLSTMLPEDAGGIPYPDLGKGVTRFLPPDYWRVEENAAIFFDELNLARSDVMLALCPALWPMADGRRRIGSLELPHNVLVIAAANPPSPGVPARPLPHFLRSRLRILYVKASAEDWIAWATARGLDPAIVTFIRRRPDLLAPPPPVDQELSPFPTPRGWEAVARSLEHERFGKLTESMLAATVGDGAAHEFWTFLENFTGLPDPLDIILGEEEFPPFDKVPDVAVAVASSVANYIIENPSEDLILAFLRQSMSWPPELVIGIQLRAFGVLPLHERARKGLTLSDFARLSPDWVRRFGSLLSD